MSYVMSMDQSISTVDNYTAYGEAIVGGEGSAWGLPDVDVGTDGSDNSYAYLQCGGDVNDGGLDTGTIGFNLNADLATGVDTLTVDGVATTYGGNASGNVGSVEVRVGADVPAQVSLTSIAVSFYQGGTLRETDSASGLSVDTTNSSSTGTAEDILIVTPASQNNDQVIVSGAMRMIAPVGTYPGPADIFCQAFVKPASA